MENVQATAATGLLANLPWRTARRDGRVVTRLLDHAELERDTALRGELEAMFRQRVSECRDFFVLRGVRARRRPCCRWRAGPWRPTANRSRASTN